MPSPVTTNLPRPRSWDELEDIVADVMQRVWRDPYVSRNGRSGQAQQGVDIHGRPAHLDNAWSGIQCKLVEELDLATIKAEVEKARGFQPSLAEFLIATTAPRDARLQEAVRLESWPFRVHVWFWEDLSLALSGHQDLLQKHFPDWMRRITTKEHVLDLIASAEPSDFSFEPSTGTFLYGCDTNLRIVLDPEQEEAEFTEPWLQNFEDTQGLRAEVHIEYGPSRILTRLVVRADGYRYTFPIPRPGPDLTISRFDYQLGRILNAPLPGYGFDEGLARAGIRVDDGGDARAGGRSPVA